MRCIIIDDEPLAVRLLESFIEKTPDLQLLASFTDSIEGAAAIKEGKADLVFLDIQMPDLDGMELARIVPPQTRIIFTTAFKEYAFESYEVKALDFLLKPIRYSKFLAAIDKAREWFSLHLQPSTIFIKVDGELRQLPLDSILYVSGMKDYVMFYITDEKRPLITHMTMKAVEEMLPDEHFMRVNRSYVVALQHIRKVDRNDCIYIGDEIIHVTEAYLPAFQAYLTQRM
ncbi:MAG: LytTR family DNA-binding domain-containing protein [Prevotella sp.]|jgi:DNA-binding LytR/AlgR family response regulator|nr:LytTR family DNA-binding domain-containing protein [Prevotella sp.]